MSGAGEWSGSLGPWARFVVAFRARAASRWAWRGLLLGLGLAVFAPLLANERPLFASFRDLRGHEAQRRLLVPIADLAARADAERSAEDRRALGDCLEQLRARLASDAAHGAHGAHGANGNRRQALAEVEQALLDLGAEPGESQALALRQAAARAAASLQLAPSDLSALTWERRFPALAALTFLDLCAMVLWLGAAGFGLTGRWGRRRGVAGRVAFLVLLSVTAALCVELTLGRSNRVDAGSWKERLAADPEATALLAPVPFGPNEPDLALGLAAPGLFGAESGPHLLGTDALGRDLAARLLHAGRTSFAVAFLATLVIAVLGTGLGLLAGTLGGVVDFAVLRAVELLQAFPTLVLLLGVVALVPAESGRSPWIVPLAIGAAGWTHVARLARAESQRVSQAVFVQAAVAAGFTRRRVLLRHVLPNSLGPVWIALAFVFSAGLVLESSLSFLGLGVPPPTASFGGLLADARASQAWWLALLPGLWLFGAIVSVHQVGEGVREALDPRASAPGAAEAPVPGQAP
jgi:peptide/nickel transport system permease protein